MSGIVSKSPDSENNPSGRTGGLGLFQGPQPAYEFQVWLTGSTSLNITCFLDAGLQPHSRSRKESRSPKQRTRIPDN